MKNTNVSSLNIPNRLKSALTVYGITDLEQLTHMGDVQSGRKLSPCEVLRRVPNFGEKSFQDLLDALIPLLIAAPQVDLDRNAVLIFNTLLGNSTGDFGGRDQAKLFAEITFDFIDAISAEQIRRSSSKEM